MSGVIDTAFYGAKGKNNDASGKCAELRASGSFIEANNGNFGDPIVGTVKDLVIKFAPATGGAPVLPTPAPGIIFTPDEFERETERHIGFKCPSQGLWMAANNDGKCDTRTYNHAGTGSWEKFWFEAGDDNKVGLTDLGGHMETAATNLDTLATNVKDAGVSNKDALADVSLKIKENARGL